MNFRYIGTSTKESDFMKYTCPYCGYKTLDEVIHMKLAKYVFGKMMGFNFEIQIMREGQTMFH